MRARIQYAVLMVVATAARVSAQTPESVLQTNFHVRYVAPDAVYIEGGRNAGLTEGTRLVIKPPRISPEKKAAKPAESASGQEAAKPIAAESPAAEASEAMPQPLVAELKVVSVAESSAVCEVVSSQRPIVAGDVATLPADELEKLVTKRSLSNTRQYPMVVSFSEGDPLDEEVRESLPRPPLPEVNRASGRIGFDYAGTQGSGGVSSSQVGFILRTDITRIGGTHWNLVGYWRGELIKSSSPSTVTQQDLINHTYQMGLIYTNPRSPWLFGMGRIFLPWASSLGVIDGGYAARKLSKQATVGILAGLQQDPTAWNYNPNRRVGGGFINFDGGSYDELKYSSTFGYAVNTLGWQVVRPYVFGENMLSYRRVLNLYHALQVDSPTASTGQSAPGVGVGSSYFSARVQASRRISFDLNHTYYRELPTYDPILVGTGLLDKLLFQGISGGARTELPMHMTVFVNVGRSSNSKDANGSWNTMLGWSMARIWRTGIRAELRYAKFDSTFAQGSYESITLSRNFTDSLRLNLQGGRQNYTMSNATNTGSNFVNATLDTNVGRRFFIELGANVQRGGQSYSQWMGTFGYRFDNRHRNPNQNSGVNHAK